MNVLGRELITAQAKSQSFADGQSVISNNGDPFTFWGVVLPAGKTILDRLPEGTRKSARWVVYAEGDPFELAAPSHRLTTSKGTLVPIEAVDYMAHTTGLPHIGYVCAEVASDE